MDAYLSLLANIVFLTVLGIAALGFICWSVESLYALRPTAAPTPPPEAGTLVTTVTTTLVPPEPPPSIHHSVAMWLDDHAAPEWRLAHRLRSVQIGLFWAIVGGLWVALPAFQSYLSPFRFACISVGFSVAILFARFTGQKGLPDA